MSNGRREEFIEAEKRSFDVTPRIAKHEEIEELKMLLTQPLPIETHCWGKFSNC